MEPEKKFESHSENTLDKDAILEELVNSLGTKILRLAFTYVKDKKTAEDITQEVFIKCYSKLDQFRGEANIKTWLYSITINLCKDHLKSWSFRNIFFSQQLPERSGGANTVLDQIFLETQKKQLATAVLNLPVKYREVIILHYYDSYKVTEISQILTLSENTIRTRMRRGKEILKQKYKWEGGLI